MTDTGPADAPETGTTDTTPPTPTPKPAEPKSDPDLAKLPDDHPLVKAHAAKKDELAQAKARLKEFEDRDKSELDKAAETAAAEKDRADTAEAELARLRAAVKHGLSEDDLDLLGTGTAEEIEARAERLAARIGDAGKERRQPNPTLGQPEGTPGVDVKSLVDSIPPTA